MLKNSRFTGSDRVNTEAKFTPTKGIGRVNSAEDMTELHLTPDESAWLDAYRRSLQLRYPGNVVRMLVYGSKARGEAHSASDVDVLIVVRNDVAHLKRALRRIGYELAATSDAVPSIMAYTLTEWEERSARGYPFHRAVERDGVSVL